MVDYKTGASPREAFEAKALFQMKFYALVLWRTRGVVPASSKLMYLADSDTLTYAPDAAELRAVRAHADGHLVGDRARGQRPVTSVPTRGRLCDWCDHQALCPAFGGTPPPFPTEAAAAAGWPTLPVVERD